MTDEVRDGLEAGATSEPKRETSQPWQLIQHIRSTGPSCLCDGEEMTDEVRDGLEAGANSEPKRETSQPWHLIQHIR